jgi:hypothetical protein
MPKLPSFADSTRILLPDPVQWLAISESTLKFHINNVLSKLQARSRYQAIYQAIVLRWL